jgi:hypothetical protein
MKKYVWIAIAIVLLFLGLIIAYTIAPADSTATDETATAAKKLH